MRAAADPGYWAACVRRPAPCPVRASRRIRPEPAIRRSPFAAPEYFQGVVWRRVFAYGIDALILCVLLVLVWLALASLTVMSLGLLHPIWIIYPLAPIAYHTLLLGGPRLATVGMRLVKTEPGSWTGERPGLFRPLIQTVLFYITTTATASLILLVALFNRRRRTVHDILAGTLVIRRFPRLTVLTPE